MIEQPKTVAVNLKNMNMIDDPMCECGDTSSQHVDGCEQCAVPECGCREFQEVGYECQFCKDTGYIIIPEQQVFDPIVGNVVMQDEQKVRCTATVHEK